MTDRIEPVARNVIMDDATGENWDWNNTIEAEIPRTGYTYNFTAGQNVTVWGRTEDGRVLVTPSSTSEANGTQFTTTEVMLVQPSELPENLENITGFQVLDAATLARYLNGS